MKRNTGAPSLSFILTLLSLTVLVYVTVPGPETEWLEGLMGDTRISLERGNKKDLMGALGTGGVRNRKDHLGL